MVEAALVMPLMVFLILGVVQLTMIQHARIMTEYAAFNAARSGIVWNGDPWVMENAAIISLMPTYGALAEETGFTDPARMMTAIVRRAVLYQVNRRLGGFLRMVGGPLLSNAVVQAFGSEGPQIVSVQIDEPNRVYFGTRMELDFDDVATAYTDVRGMWSRYIDNHLTIRVRYLYFMRIPFANWVIHHAWLSQRAGIQLYGAIWNPQGERPFATGFDRDNQRATYQDIAARLVPRGADPLWRDLALAGRAGVYMIPLTATYTMRVQSNLYARHFWGLELLR
jgi:hypothetical protein